MVTVASANDFADFLLEFEQVPWEEIKATARQTPENRTQFVGHVYRMLTTDGFLSAFCKQTDREVPKGDRAQLAQEIADIILTAKL